MCYSLFEMKFPEKIMNKDQIKGRIKEAQGKSGQS